MTADDSQSPIIPGQARPADWRRLLRAATAALFIGAGVNHFRVPQMYQSIMPPGFGDPASMVAMSGVFEILGGVALLIRPLRKAAGIGLILLLISIFPVNIWMALRPELSRPYHVPPWALWCRLPLQGVLIATVAYAAGLRRH